MIMSSIAGTPAEFRSVHVTLRAPRVAIEVARGVGWESRAALALHAAGQAWGGAGFAVVFGGSEGVPPSIARALRAFDPDYLCGLEYTASQMEAMHEGWLVKQFGAQVQENLPDDWPETVVSRARPSSKMLGVSSPFLLRHGSDAVSQVQCISAVALQSLPTASLFKGPNPRGVVLAAPAGLKGSLGLSVAMRCGFAQVPELPFVDETTTTTDLASLLRFAVGGDAQYATRELLEFGSGIAMSVLPKDAPTVWESTKAGLVPVSGFRPQEDTYVIVGDSEDDFSLALILHRMFKRVCWVPRAWTEDEASLPALRWGLHDLMRDGLGGYGDTVYTSVSLAQSDVEDVFRVIWGDPEAKLGEQKLEGQSLWDTPIYCAPARLHLEGPSFLACPDDDYDISTAIPGNRDPDGGFSFATPLPAFVPKSADLAGPRRPFWEVDVSVQGVAIPPVRHLPADVLQAPNEHQRVRSGRDGVTFHAQNMGLVMSSESLQQSTARPLLHFPSLLEWIVERGKAYESPCEVNVSDAGRRAKVAARLFGNRERLVEELPQVLDVLREFLPPSNRSSQSYPERDGVVLAGRQGLLSFQAVLRVLGEGVGKREARDVMDRLLEGGVLRRGLVLNCEDCGQLSFYPLESLRQENSCPRCTSNNSLSLSRWRMPIEEPQWYYDLHGAIREMLAQDGDVPLLAARYLKRKSRNFYDVPEVDFIDERGVVREVDLVALANDQLIVGEAKRRANLGGRSDRAKSVDKLVHIARVLQADQLLLCSTENAEWAHSDVAALQQRLAPQEWTAGPPPSLRILTGLSPDGQANDTVVVA